MRDLTILGSTGSIGTQALDVIQDRDEFRVRGLAARGSRPALLAEQVERHRPDVVAVADPEAADALARHLADCSRPPRILAGPDAATELAADPVDVLLNGADGAAGLLPTLAGLAAGSTVALANKESLIIGREVVTRAAAAGQLVPVDSEHSALAQCLRAGRTDEVDRLVLTASGGPFRGRTREELAEVTPAQALAHPTWNMGRVITTNSATLVNKGLEVLEAQLLFDMPIDRIDVVVHPQSIVHSMVQFTDGSTIAQVSPPDMRLAIGLALAWPERLPGSAAACDWSTASTWTFEPVDEDVFAGLSLARRAGRAGFTAPAVLNAANEECVEAFHEGELTFLGICDTVGEVLDEHIATMTHEPLTVEAVLAADRWAREAARERVGAAV